MIRRLQRYYYGLIMTGVMLATVGLWATPSLAAELVSVRYGLFEQSLPVADLHRYAETREVTPALRGFLRFTNREQQESLQALLHANLPVDLVAIDRVLNAPIGVELLTQLAAAIAGGDRAGVQALRAAVVLGSQPHGLSLLSFLDAYPDHVLTLDIPNALKVVDAISPKPPKDTLSTLPVWRTLVAYQVAASRDKAYRACLFGDSISAQLIDSLGPQTFNFALGGMSTVSLVAQLQQLTAANTTCQEAIIAIGTNDAWYTIADDRFTQNLKTAIALTRQLGAQRIVLIPAFYSTLAASKNPDLAGPLPRVDAINQLIRDVATAESVPVDAAAIQPLFDGNTLKASLTIDGVHLNAAGISIYRQGLLNILPPVP